MSGSRPAIGVDIGGTKIAAAVVGDGVILRRAARATPRAGGAAVLDATVDLVHQLMEPGEEISGVGIGAPGVIDATTGSVLSATDVLPGWAGTPVQAELEERLGLPVAVDNDVRVMARAEVVPAVHAGAREVLFVSVGTGVGGAISHDGAVRRGPHGCTGEIAHLLVPTEGAVACGCGRRDHLEAVASGPAIVAGYVRRTGVPADDLRDVIRRGTGGDQDAVAVVREAGDLLGRALAGLVNAIDVEAVIIGGGVAQVGELFIEPLRRALRDELLAVVRAVPVSTASSGTDAPLLGAALLVADPQVQTSEGVVR